MKADLNRTVFSRLNSSVLIGDTAHLSSREAATANARLPSLSH